MSHNFGLIWTLGLVHFGHMGEGPDQGQIEVEIDMVRGDGTTTSKYVSEFYGLGKHAEAVPKKKP